MATGDCVRSSKIRLSSLYYTYAQLLTLVDNQDSSRAVACTNAMRRRVAVAFISSSRSLCSEPTRDSRTKIFWLSRPLCLFAFRAVWWPVDETKRGKEPSSKPEALRRPRTRG